MVKTKKPSVMKLIYERCKDCIKEDDEHRPKPKECTIVECWLYPFRAPGCRDFEGKIVNSKIGKSKQARNPGESVSRKMAVKRHCAWCMHFDQIKECHIRSCEFYGLIKRLSVEEIEQVQFRE